MRIFATRTIQNRFFVVVFFLLFFAFVRCGSVFKSTFLATPYCHSNIYQFIVAKNKRLRLISSKEKQTCFKLVLKSTIFKILNIKYSHWKYEYKKTEDILWVLITLCYFLRIWLNWVRWTSNVEGITNCEDHFMLRHNAFRLASL